VQSLPDMKSVLIASEVLPLGINVGDPRSRWSRVALMDCLPDEIFLPLEDSFDSSIPEVSYPTAQTKGHRNFPGKCPVKDALNSSIDEHMGPGCLHIVKL